MLQWDVLLLFSLDLTKLTGDRAKGIFVTASRCRPGRLAGKTGEPPPAGKTGEPPRLHVEPCSLARK